MLVRKGRESSIARRGPSSAAGDKIPFVTRPRRTLNRFDRLVRVPIGLLWLAVLAILAVPLLIFMTLLYWIVRGARSLSGRGRTTRADRSGTQERAA
jgi:hypothetical protein